jgi:hypothetical protein
VSAQKGLEPMEVPHDIGRAVHKYRRWFGAVFVVAAGFSAFILVGRVDDAEVVSALGGKTSPIIVAWIVESLRWFLVLGSVLAVVIGVMLGLSPSALTALETRVDRWYSHRQIDKGADKMHLALDRWVESFPRTAGWSIAVGAVVVLIVAAVVLLRHH